MPSPYGSFAGERLTWVQGVVDEPPGTLLPWRHHDEAGNRFVRTIPTDLPVRPVRVYASLGNAPTPEQRVDLAIRELERQGAFRRGYIMVGIGTGAGHINPVALEALERLADGDTASVAIQFGTLPSFMSLKKVNDSRELHELLLRRLKRRIRELYPHGGGPKVLVYGESLGAWASEGIIEAAAKRRPGRRAHPLDVLGVHRVVHTGTPGLSQFDRRLLGPGGMQAMRGVEELGLLTRRERRTARVWELSHADDPVSRVDMRKLTSSPMEFLASVVGVIRDRTNAKPGIFTNHTHDYRLELPRLLRTAFGFEHVSDARLARISEQVRRSEAWIMDQDWTS